ncbi:MAG: hypothetical protein FWG32_00375 [Oscillospiraceae bacterium]|nr:hypothetical protein [Oscillospiraceae bacterium]
MTPIEILHEIVTTEHNARQLYESAVKNRNYFKEYMNEKTAAIRHERFEEAYRRTEEFDRSETGAADEEIRQIDDQFNVNLKKYKDYFEANKEKTAKKMFDMITAQDPGEENV